MREVRGACLVVHIINVTNTCEVRCVQKGLQFVPQISHLSSYCLFYSYLSRHRLKKANNWQPCPVKHPPFPLFPSKSSWLVPLLAILLPPMATEDVVPPQQLCYRWVDGMIFLGIVRSRCQKNQHEAPYTHQGSNKTKPHRPSQDEKILSTCISFKEGGKVGINDASAVEEAGWRFPLSKMPYAQAMINMNCGDVMPWFVHKI